MRSCAVHIVDRDAPQIRSPINSLQIGGFRTDIVASKMSTPVIPSADAFNPATDSLHSSMRPIIMLAQCFSMFPVSGVNTPDASHLKFTWRSFKIVYTVAAFLGSFTISVYNISRIISTGLTTTNMTQCVFYGTSVITSMLFLKLARQWPCLMLTWEKLEQELVTRHRRVGKISLATRFKILTIVVMLLALLEHTFSILQGYINARECTDIRGDEDTSSTYFQMQFPQVFSKTSYSLWKAVLVYTVNILSTFSWNFVDLFLILVSMALADQFRQLNSRLYSVRGKAMPEWWWAEARNDYNHLATLTRRLDTHISAIVLLSFATDLYFICLQLLFSFNPMRGTMQKVYFYFSFGFLLSRTTTVSLYAASIHDESLLPAPVLYSVSGGSYTAEILGQTSLATQRPSYQLCTVMRFLTQVTTDSICLTGMKFFSVTRGLVLTVAGTIVTYELVLVQFNSVQQIDPLNITNACEPK